MQATEHRLDDDDRAQLLDHAETLAARDGPLLEDRDDAEVIEEIEAMADLIGA